MNIKPYTGVGDLLITAESIDYINSYRALYRKDASRLVLNEFTDKKVCISFNTSTSYNRVGGEGHAGYNYGVNPTMTFDEFRKATTFGVKDRLKFLKI